MTEGSLGDTDCNRPPGTCIPLNELPSSRHVSWARVLTAVNMFSLAMLGVSGARIRCRMVNTIFTGGSDNICQAADEPEHSTQA